jgi:hypothetical protein
LAREKSIDGIGSTLEAKTVDEIQMTYLDQRGDALTCELVLNHGSIEMLIDE